MFYYNGSSFSEFTDEVKKYASGEKSITMATGNYIYIASDFPFNHIYFKLGTSLNNNVASMSIEYYDANSWVPVVDKHDYTNTFANSGFIEFTPNKDKNWSSEDSEDITELEDIVVYDKYWTRISFSALLDAVSIKWMGNLFSDDNDLYAEYPIFNDSNFLTAFSAGKTSWEEQHVKASELIIADLKRKSIIFAKEQILDRDVLLPAAVSKVAEIIYNAFGKDYLDAKKVAQADYKNRLELNQFNIDTNNDAILDKHEVVATVGWMSR